MNMINEDENKNKLNLLYKIIIGNCAIIFLFPIIVIAFQLPLILIYIPIISCIAIFTLWLYLYYTDLYQEYIWHIKFLIFSAITLSILLAIDSKLFILFGLFVVLILLVTVIDRRGGIRRIKR